MLQMSGCTRTCTALLEAPEPPIEVRPIAQRTEPQHTIYNKAAEYPETYLTDSYYFSQLSNHGSKKEEIQKTNFAAEV